MIALAVTMATAAGCVDVRKLDVTSFNVNSVSPEGFRAIRAAATVGIDNPSGSFRIYEMEGTVHRGQQELGSFVIDPVTVAARTEDRYTVKGRLTLNDSISAFELLSLIPKFKISEYNVDLCFKIKPKGGVAQKVKLRDIPAEKLISMLK